MSKNDRKSNFTYNHARRLYRAAQKKPEELFATLKSSYKGLKEEDVKERLSLFGENHFDDHKDRFSLGLLSKAIRNPINYLVLGLAFASLIAGNVRASGLMLFVVVLSITMTFFQEKRFRQVVLRLLSIVEVKVTVIRNYTNANKKSMEPPTLNMEVSISELVPGDIVRISAGDIIPADIRLLSSKNLLVNQSVLTGETIPVDKDSEFDDALLKSLPDLKNICFLGSSVVNGTGIGIVIHTGHDAYVNTIAKQEKVKLETSFENGAHAFVIRTLKFMLLMIPLIFILSLISKGSWKEALLFAITTTVSLTPKSLPLTISGNLTRGALAMLKKRVVVKHLSAIQNIGAMNILCTDKTGTLTEDFTVCGGAFSPTHEYDENVMLYGFLNSFFQTGMKNHLDFALIKHAEFLKLNSSLYNYQYLDELPFDPSRKRISVLINVKNEFNLFICKGALEEILPICTAEGNNGHLSMVQKINEMKTQALAIAYKIFPRNKKNCTVADEVDLTLLGYVKFLDPPIKEGINDVLHSMNEYGVAIKILTGDNHWDAIKVAKQLGLNSSKVLLGNQIESMSDKDLEHAAEKCDIFAKLTPDHKQRIIHSLQDLGHTVGYLGDGINDVPALFASDVGISVNNAVSTAKESSDIVLLEKDLSVLLDGIVEGRKAFFQVDRYIKVGAVVKFGFMISLLGASIFLPFLPFTPIQMLIQNMIFDLSQLAMPFDKVNPNHLKTPSRWRFAETQKFRLHFGPIISLFDFITFALMWFVFSTKTPLFQGVFQSAWLIESIFIQCLVVHLFHSIKIDFKKNISKPSFITTMISFVIAIYLPYSPLKNVLGFSPLPFSYFLWLFIIVLTYCIITQILKTFLSNRYSLRI